MPARLIEANTRPLERGTQYRARKRCAPVDCGRNQDQKDDNESNRPPAATRPALLFGGPI